MAADRCDVDVMICLRRFHVNAQYVQEMTDFLAYVVTKLRHILPGKLLPRHVSSLAFATSVARWRTRMISDQQPATAGTSQDAHTPTQAALLEMWRQILWVPDVGLHDSFLDLGGHSLTAARCINRIRVVFNVDVPLDAFFVEPADIATIAGIIDAAERR